MTEEIDVKQDNYLSNYYKRHDENSEDDTSAILLNLIKELNIPKKDPDRISDGWIIIANPLHEKIILECYFDSDKRKILELASDLPKTIMEILGECNMAQTSAYRKVTALIQKGLLVRAGHVFSNGRVIIKYKPVFEKIRVSIVKDKIILEVKLAKPERPKI